MANPTFNAALIAQQGLELLAAKYPVIGMIATDFSKEPVKFNQQVISRIPSVGQVQDYSNSTGYAAGSASFTDASVTLNKFKHATFTLTDDILASASYDIVTEYATSFAEGIGQQVMSDIAALFTSGNYSNATTVALTASNRKTVIVAGNAALNKRNVNASRYGIFNPDLVSSLWSDDSVVYMTAGGTGIEAGKLPVIHGVAISEYSVSRLATPSGG